LILPSIKKNTEEKKLNETQNLNATKTDKAEFQRTFEVNKKLESLHKEIDIIKIFDSFKNIVDLSSINELKSQFNDRNKKIFNDDENKISSNCLNDITILYNNLPKINGVESFNRKSKDNSDLSGFNWSPIDIVASQNKIKKKIISTKKLKGFSINNRKINFSKSDSIFITNATAEKTFITNNHKNDSEREKDDFSRRIFRDKNLSNLIDPTINQSSILNLDT
jgi:hypothetical protein